MRPLPTRLQKAMEGKKIDVLVLNSGVLHVAAPGDATFAQEMKDSVAVNATAPAVILHTLLPNLQVPHCLRPSLSHC